MDGETFRHRAVLAPLLSNIISCLPYPNEARHAMFAARAPLHALLRAFLQALCGSLDHVQCAKGRTSRPGGRSYKIDGGSVCDFIRIGNTAQSGRRPRPHPSPPPRPKNPSFAYGMNPGPHPQSGAARKITLASCIIRRTKLRASFAGAPVDRCRRGEPHTGRRTNGRLSSEIP